MSVIDKVEYLKKLLNYHCCGEVEISDNECCEYFNNFFTNRKSKYKDYYFKQPCVKIFIIGAYLSTIAENPTLCLRYFYDGNNNEGFDSEFILFNDKNAKYEDGHGKWGYGKEEYAGDLDYEDIDEHIWDLIIKYVSFDVKEDMDRHLNNAKSSVKYYTEKIEEFNNFIYGS